MSASPYFYVEKYNSKTEKWELQHPYVWDYNHTKLIPADLFPFNGCHEMFSIIKAENSYDYPEMKGVKYGLPKDVCDEIRKGYDECTYDGWHAGEKVFPDVRWFTYADMLIYLLQNPKVKNPDWYEGDECDEPKEIDNPVYALKERVDNFLEVFNQWNFWVDQYSQIRIVYWVIY